MSLAQSKVLQRENITGGESGSRVRERLLNLFLLPLPLIGFLGGVFQITSLLAIVVTSFRKKTIVLPAELITLLLVFFCCLILQVVTNTYYPVQVDALVTDVSKRSLLTFGSYVSSGSANVSLLIRFLVGFTVFYLVRDLTTKVSSATLVTAIKRVLICCVIFQFLILFAVALLDGAYLLKVAIGQGDPTGPSNYLTTDEFGYRLSLGFYEPSHMSVFLGPLIALQARLISGLRNLLWFFLLTLFFAVTSRSASIVFSFVIIYLILDNRRMLVSLGVGFVLSLFIGVAQYLSYFRTFDSYNLLRSMFERSHIPEIEGFKSLHWAFGVDFGQVYSFVPIYNQMLTMGLFFWGVLFLFWRKDLRKIYSFFALFFVVPQPWTLIPWISLGLVHGALSLRRL